MRRQIIMLFCLASSTFFVCAADETPPAKLTAMDVFHLEFAADPQISPDGKRVVYVRQFSDIMTDKRYSNLWIVNADGSDHQPLTSGNHSNSSPRWSRDGKRLIYVSDQEGTPQIYQRWMESGLTAKVTSLQFPPTGINLSPDGKWISFVSLVPAKPVKLADLPTPPPGAKWADPAKVIDKLVYRFNGPGYLPNGFTHLFVVPSDGGEPRQLSKGDFNHGTSFRPSEAVWTPDSKYLLLSANRRTDADAEPLDSEIYEFAVADGAMKQLTNRRGPDNSPAVSPDGKQIAYLGFDDKYQGYQVTQLYVMNRDGSDTRVLPKAQFRDRDFSSPRWSADGKGLFAIYDDRGMTKLAYLTLDGELTNVADRLGSSDSAYSGGASFSVADGQTVTLTQKTTADPGNVFVTKAGGDPSQLTRLNESLLVQKHPGKVEEIWYESSADRRQIQGWIIKPPDFDPKKKYPLILEIHGGPFANYGPRFDIEKQVWASMGYVVLYTNPRGSTSYGGEFGNLIHHQYPGDDFQDLNAGVDAVVAKGYVDTNNLFVTGGSGGGVLTCWVIGHTTRFRAAVTVYPVINWYSFTLTSDIGNFTSKYWFPGMPWDNLSHYEKRSLLSVVKNVKTPTMVLCGEEDFRTPMSESEQYYQALKLLGVESVLVRVPGEPHGIRVRPSHHMAKIQYIAGWFEKHRQN
jgi:acylaminoacyl-peptidase